MPKISKPLLQALHAEAKKNPGVLPLRLETLRQKAVQQAKLGALSQSRYEECLKKIQEGTHLGSAGPLFGSLFSAKESLDVQDLAISDGRKITFEKSSDKSCFAVELLEQAGALCIGKGNMAESGRAYNTVNDLYGLTRNPWNESLSPGGSGGGDAVAVAAGLCDFALGVDAGGSVRIPASFCGLIGHLPTPGLIGHSGMKFSQHHFWQLFRGIGSITCHPQDSLYLAEHLFCYDPQDSRSCSFPEHQTKKLSERKAPLRIGYFTNLGSYAAEQSVEEHIRKVAKRLENTFPQAAIQEIPGDLFAACLAPFVVLCGQASLALEDLLLLQIVKRPLTPEEDGKVLQALRKQIAERLPPLNPETLLGLESQVQILRGQAAYLFQNFDAVLCPVASCSSFSLTDTSMRAQKKELAGKSTAIQLEPHEAFLFSSAVNVLGLPSVCFPLPDTNGEFPCDEHGIPMSAQLVGARFSDYLLLDILSELFE